MAQPLEKLEFLIGKWSGKAEGFGDEGELSMIASFAYEPGENVISGFRESRHGKELENRILMMFLHDRNSKRLIRKDIYSYGFVVNQIGDVENGRFIFNCVNMDSEPDYFKNVKFRTFIEKISEKRIVLGIEVAKQGEDYRLYGQQKLTKQ